VLNYAIINRKISSSVMLARTKREVNFLGPQYSTRCDIEVDSHIDVECQCLEMSVCGERLATTAIGNNE
jgi:hypothetical protein